MQDEELDSAIEDGDIEALFSLYTKATTGKVD